MKRKRIIRTSNKEIYEKLNMLNISTSVVLENATKKQLGKMIKNINKKELMIDVHHVGDFVIVKKKKPLDFSVYLK